MGDGGDDLRARHVLHDREVHLGIVGFDALAHQVAQDGELELVLHLIGIVEELAIAHHHAAVPAVAGGLADHAEADHAAGEHEIAVLLGLVELADIAQAADLVDRRPALQAAGGGGVVLQRLHDGHVAVRRHGVVHEVALAGLGGGERDDGAGQQQRLVQGEQGEGGRQLFGFHVPL